MGNVVEGCCVGARDAKVNFPKPSWNVPMQSRGGPNSSRSSSPVSSPVVTKLSPAEAAEVANPEQAKPSVKVEAEVAAKEAPAPPKEVAAEVAPKEAPALPKEAPVPYEAAEASEPAVPEAGAPPAAEAAVPAAEQPAKEEVAEAAAEAEPPAPPAEAPAGGEAPATAETAAVPTPRVEADAAAEAAAPPSKLGATKVELWDVIGGGDKGGIIVRARKELTSAALARLDTGSRIKEMERDGDRMKYKLMSGVGPNTGWISMSVKGKDMIRPVK